jgi:hypothetical protein
MTPKEEKLLEWIKNTPSGMVLESQIVGSGLSKALNELLLKGLVELDAHPTVKDGNASACVAILCRGQDYKGPSS